MMPAEMGRMRFAGAVAGGLALPRSVCDIRYVTNGTRRTTLPKPVDLERALAEAGRMLEGVGGDVALIGGAALNIHGIERYTKDVDFAVAVDQSGRAEQVLKAYDPRPLRIGGVSFETPSGARLDLVDHRFRYRPLYDAAIRAAKTAGLLVEAGGVEIPVVPIEYLVAMKLAAGRPQDEADLHRLLRRNDLDYRSCREVAERHLGLFAAEALDRFARAAGRADAPRRYDEEYGVE